MSNYISAFLLVVCSCLYATNSSLKGQIAELQAQQLAIDNENLLRLRDKEAQIENAGADADKLLSIQVTEILRNFEQIKAQQFSGGFLPSSSEPKPQKQNIVTVSADGGNGLHWMQCQFRECGEDVSPSAGGDQVAKASEQSERAAQCRPPKASSGVSAKLLKRLNKCEQRLLYEAKEYDLLAAHYNALLSLYQKAREVNNGEK